MSGQEGEGTETQCDWSHAVSFSGLQPPAGPKQEGLGASPRPPGGRGAAFSAGCY